MRGEAYLDAENLFRNVRATRRADLEQQGFDRGIDHGLFPGAKPDDVSASRRARKYLDVLNIWFRVNAGADTLAIHSYGKPKGADHGYQAVQWALQQMQSRYQREGTTYHLHPVGNEKNAAEDALVRGFQRGLQRGDLEDSVFLIGGEDHDALYPVDHARLENPDLNIWIVLPARNAVWRRFRPQDAYPNLDPKQVFTFAEVLNSVWEDQASVVRRRRARQKEWDREAVRTARRLAGIGGRLSESQAQERASLEHAIARLVGIHEAGLTGAKPGTRQWRNAIGNDWVVDAAEKYLSRHTAPAEIEAVGRGVVVGSRVAHLVRMAALEQLLENESPMVVSAFVLGLARHYKDYGRAAAAVVEVMTSRA